MRINKLITTENAVIPGKASTSWILSSYREIVAVTFNGNTEATLKRVKKGGHSYADA